MRSLDDLYNLFTRRRAEQSADGSSMHDLAVIYDGGLVTRMAELDKVAESAVPNLIAQGIDQYARFSAEARPDVDFAAVRPNIAGSRQKASERAEVVKGWWRNSAMTLLDYQRFRFYYGYGFMPAAIRPDLARGVPRWQALNPIGVYPGPREIPYSPEVPDAFAVTMLSARDVRERWGVDFGTKTSPDRMLEVVEYQDAEQVTWFCVGPSGPDRPTWPHGTPGAQAWSWDLGTGWNYGSEIIARRISRIPGPSGNWLALLSSTPNLAGRCLISCPGAISLSKVTGFINAALSKHHMQARLMGLTQIAIARDILRDEWIEMDPGTGQAGVIREADGRRGIRGIIEGKITVPNHTPGYQTFPYIDRLEAYQRSETGIIAELGGESGTNIRTRARGEAIAENVIDPRVREAHEIMQNALENETKGAIAWAKGYRGARKTTVFVGSRGQQGKEYAATDLFENDNAVVRYPLAGTNVNGATIVGGQLVGTGLAALDTIRRLHPWIENADDEATKIRTEAAEAVLLANLQAVVESSPDDAAFITKRFREGALPEVVFEEVQRRAQERQASAAPEGDPLGPVAPGSPEAQPGLGEPGVANAPPVIEEPPPSLRNLASLMTTSRRPSMTVPAERAG